MSNVLWQQAPKTCCLVEETLSEIEPPVNRNDENINGEDEEDSDDELVDENKYSLNKWQRSEPGMKFRKF